MGYIKMFEDYSVDKHEYIGYRAKSSNTTGKHGTFYTFENQNRETIKKIFTFENPLILSNENVKQFEGLPLEYLFYKWFPNYNLKLNADKLGLETGELIDKIVTNKAIEMGYDAIIMGDLEFVDLRKM